jgi:3-hydroxyisobutyrate dehydrogenase-like beta-hydroxyacid dehydrogenase
MKVGFIGLGKMGSAVASRILHAGHTVSVWNRSPGPVGELVAAGAVAAQRPEDALQGDCVLSMLANDAAVHDVGLDGDLLGRAAPGLVHANLSTISVDTARRLASAHAARGPGYVASPVFGRPDVAAAGNLTIVAAGAPASIERLQPVFATFGQRTAVVGDAPERANLFKLAGNFLIAAAIESMAEAFALVRKGGIDPALFHDVLTNSLFSAPVYQGYGRLIVTETYEPPGLSLNLGLKDVDLARAAAGALQVPLPLADLVHDHFTAAVAAGLGEQDWASVASLIADQAGLPPAAGRPKA